MNKKHLLIGFLLVLFKPAFAQDQPSTTTFTLQEAVKYALSNNEEVKKSKLDEQNSEYKIKEIKGSGLPQITANGRLTMNPAIATQLLPGEIIGQPGTMVPVKFGTKYIGNGGIELQQLIFKKSFFVDLQAANTTQDLYRLRTQMSQEVVIYNVASAYVQLLQTREQFNTIDANFKKLEQLEKILDLQYKNDIATKVALNRVTVNKINLENQRQTLEATYNQQLNGLKFFMGLPMDQEIAIAETDIVLNTPVIAQENTTEVLNNRIDYKLLVTQRELNKLNVKNIQAGYYPTISAFGSYGANAQRNEFNFHDFNQPWFNTAAIGVQLSVPIFDGFQRRNQILQAKNEIQKTELDINRTMQSTNQALKNARTQMQSSLRAIESQERNVALAQEVYRNTNELYKEGLSPLTEVLDTEVSLREAQTNLNFERLKYQLAQLSYLLARGEIQILAQ